MIRIQNLEKYFGEHRILNNLNLEIKAGEVFGIVGHSGAGKSTLLRCLNGLEGYDSGSITVMGQEVKELDKTKLLKLRSQMGMIFQTFNLMTRKTVFDNIAFPLQVWRTEKKDLKKRVLELLELVGLAHKAYDRIQSLSGGQKQRVGIARALALNPKILLCDEATSALDPNTTNSILDLLNNINKQLGLTIVLVTHQMEVVKRLCHSMLLLEGGDTQAMGKTDALFLSPTVNLKKLISEEYALIPSGTNIRLIFPREISQQTIITSMARKLNVDFSIVGGKLERYLDDVLGFLIINVEDNELDKVLEYLQEKKLFWEILDEGAEKSMAEVST